MATRPSRSVGSPRGSREGEAWIANYLDGCDTIYPSVDQIATQPAQETLYCLGGVMPDDYELTGDLYCDFGDVEGLHSGPEWIEFDRFCELRATDWTLENGRSFRVWGQAVTSLLESGSPVDGQYTVVGHFDDPGSSECEAAAIEGVRRGSRRSRPVLSDAVRRHGGDAGSMTFAPSGVSRRGPGPSARAFVRVR